MNLAIFGATGLLGKELVKEASARGHNLRILSRRDLEPGEMPEGTVVIKGDYLDNAAMLETLEGAEAVLSTVGPPAIRKTDLTPGDYERAMVNLIAGMKENGIKRIINVASTGTRYGDEKFKFMRWLISSVFKILWPVVIPGKEAELKVLSQSDLDWTTLRPPGIVTGAGGELRVDDKIDQGIRVDTNLMAQFMLDQIDSDEWVGRAPFVGS